MTDEQWPSPAKHNGTTVGELQGRLRESERRRRLYEAALSNTPDLVYVFDLEHRFTYANEGLLRMWGKSWEEAIGKTCLELGYPDWHAAMHDREIEQVVATKQPVKGEVPFTGTFGRRIYEYIFVPVLSDTGKVEAVAGTTRDVTEHRETEDRFRRSEGQVRTILESITDAFVAVDPQWRFTYVNAEAERIYGRKREELVGQSLWEAFPELIGNDFEEPFRRAMASQTPLHIDGPYEPLGGWFDVRVFPVESGGLAFYFRDVSEQREAERLRKETHERFRAFMENSPVTAFIKDEDGRYVFVNRKIEQTLARPAVEWIGKTDADIFSANDANQYRANDLKVLASGKTAAFEEGMDGPDGRYHFLSFKFPLVNEDGRRLIAGMSLDMTAQKRTEEALRLQYDLTRSITNTATTAIFLMDSEGRVTFMNPAAEQISGFSFEELYGLVLHDQVHHHYLDGTPFLMDECLIGQSALRQEVLRGHEDMFVRKDGTFFPVRCNASPLLHNGELTGIVLEVQDITEQKRAIEALKEADRRKDEFLATLAHELRNPLAPIRNAVQVLRIQGPPDPDLIWSRAVIDRQVAQMARLLDDLLDVSRITRNKMELRKSRVSLAVVLESALETSHPLIDQMGHRLTLTLPNEPVILDADLTRLAQVFSNLLTNAAKYSDRNGHIQISAQRRNAQVIVSVRDTGIGIASDHLPYIFEMFSQAAPALDRSQGGLGIGLSLVRGLVELHGGTIEAKSEGPGQGSEFVVWLPLASEDSHPKSLSVEAESNLVKSSLRILVVDDNRDGANSLSLMLKMMGNETRAAFDGEAAITVAREFQPDVILLDIGLPKLNGYEACRAIRQMPFAKNIVIIAQTGWGQDEDRQKSQAAGFDFHLVKPVDSTELAKLLAGLRRQTK